MGCSGCNKNQKFKPIFKDLPNEKKIISNNIINNTAEAFKKQTDKFQWFRDGITGIVKCLTGNTLYSDDDIIKNRNICRECEYSTKDSNGKITTSSQCMAPDPKNNNIPCGCFIVCKTQSSKCPLEKWTHLTISVNNPTKPIHNNNLQVEI